MHCSPTPPVSESPRRAFRSRIALVFGLLVLPATVGATGCSEECGVYAACDDCELSPNEGELLVSGQILRREGEFSDNRPFVPRQGARVELRLGYDDGLADGSIDPRGLAIIPIDGELPFSFEMRGDPASTFFASDSLERDLESYRLSVVVYNHDDCDTEVGDLIGSGRFKEAGAAIEVLVEGLESCDSPGAGGFCL